MTRAHDVEVGPYKVGWTRRRSFKVGAGPRGVVGRSMHGPRWYRERFVYLAWWTLSLGRRVDA